jgi:hypothetical protein
MQELTQIKYQIATNHSWKFDGSTSPVRLTSFAQGSPERSRRTLTIDPEQSRRVDKNS